MRHARRAFSLIELVVATGILALIMGAMTSMMIFTAQAMPIKTDPDVRTEADGRALREALWMLADAKTCNVSNANQVAFRTGDVTGDAADDDVRLTFSGTTGDPLKLNINGQQQDLITDVASVTFTLSTRAHAQTTVSGTYETAEMLLDGWVGPMTDQRTGTLTRTLAMQLHPQLPHDATHFRITRARYFVRPVASKTCHVTLSIADPTAGNLPDITRVRANASTTHTGLASGGAWVNQAFASNTYWHAANERPFLWAGTTNSSSEFELGVDLTAPHAGEFVYMQLLQSPERAGTGAMMFEVYGVARRPASVTSAVQAATALEVVVVRTDGTRIAGAVVLRNQPNVP